MSDREPFYAEELKTSPGWRYTMHCNCEKRLGQIQLLAFVWTPIYFAVLYLIAHRLGAILELEGGP